MIEIAVTATLLTRPYTKRLSGRDRTAAMLSVVGGEGGPAGSGTMSAPCLKTLTSTR
ncbi:hypothetical protein [Streptosporangium vulgare]|uniref:Uncharacterized protein n=1 Tax=Streptosporangium vulgare TaxID=46190 RepID=A0ABV5TLV2_9ACTN